jgi:hypothetical protein
MKKPPHWWLLFWWLYFYCSDLVEMTCQILGVYSAADPFWDCVAFMATAGFGSSQLLFSGRLQFSKYDKPCSRAL